jgi:uncharacterized membrane protein
MDVATFLENKLSCLRTYTHSVNGSLASSVAAELIDILLYKSYLNWILGSLLNGKLK